MSFWSVVFGAFVMLLVAVFAPNQFNKLVSTIRSAWDRFKGNDTQETPPEGKS
jgi:hypothetical protein